MATPSKQELDQINSLLNDIQQKYDQLGKENPFKGFDTKGIKDANASIKQLDAGLKGVSSEVRDINDAFSNTFQSLQSIVGELTNGKAATNKIVNSTKALESVSSQILSQRDRGIKLDSKELMSMQKKADVSFENLKQQSIQVEKQLVDDKQRNKAADNYIRSLKGIKNLNAAQKAELEENLAIQKETGRAIKKNGTVLKNVNEITKDGSDFQKTINGGLKQEILDRKKIEGSVGITGGLLSSLSKVTGITGIFDIDKIKSEAEEVAQEAIDAFRETQDYIDQEGKLSLNLENARTELLGLQNILKGTSVEKLQEELKALEEDRKIEVNVELPEVSNPERIKELDDQIASLTKNIKKVGGLDNLEKSITKSEKGLEDLNDKARSQANSMSSQFKILGGTLSSVFEGLTNSLKSPEAIFTALIALASEVNSQVVDLSKSLNVSYDESQKIREEFTQITLAAGDTVINTQRLVEAQLQFNEALGIAGKIIPENAAAQSKLTNQLGASVESSTKLRQIAEATGEDFREQTLAQYETVSAISAQEGVAINVKGVIDEVGKAGAFGLAQFQGSVVALTEGVAQAKALGLSLDQVNSIAGKLMDFESSINAELEAELLLGKNINLEKARLAALNNDQKTLMEEINREMGTFEDFSKMNRIQQEAMANAVGMTADGLSEALLLQQYGEMNQKEIVALKGEEVAKQVEMVKSQEAFQNAILAAKGAFADMAAGPLGDVAKLITDLLSNTTLMYSTLGLMAIGPLTSIGKSLQKAFMASKAMLGVQKSQLIVETAMGAKAKITAAFQAAKTAATNPLLGVAAVAGAVLAYKGIQALTADDFISPGYGKRTLSSPEGTIAFNDKDTIVAGTNLEQNTTTNINTPTQNSVINRPTTNSMVSNNQSQPQVVAPANNTMMEGELKAIKRVLENIATKEGTVSMNGTKFGTVTAMNTYQLQ